MAKELRSKYHGDPSTRKSRAITRTINTILKLAQELLQPERTDTCLLQYLHVAVQDAEFAKTAQLISLADRNISFEKLNLSILTAAQLEDNSKTKTRNSVIHLTEKKSDNSIDFDQENEELFDQYFVDHRLAIKAERDL